MTRSKLVLAGLAATSTLSFLAAFTAERSAEACGGCFHPPTQTASDITDERMLLSVSPTQTTLYDQILYAGSPSSFAWVLPIHGTVTVGLSADVLFDSIAAVTNTQITAPPANCPAPTCGFGGISAPVAGAAFADAAAAGVVTVTKQENVGPYATVQLHATDSGALDTWLTQNGFDIPAAVQPVLDAYVAEGFDFLAMKLLPDQGVQAMRPVRVTTTGASLSLPLRMAAIGTGVTVGITIWVVSDGRYEPQNFPFFHIDDAQLVWDFSTSSSNYTTLRAQLEAASHNRAWEIESSLNLNEQTITSVILNGGTYFAGGGFGGPIAPTDATEDYLPVGAPDAGGDGGAYQSADEVRTADVAALFAGMAGPNVRITRMRSDIAHAAMTTDFVVQASADQSELSNIRYVTQSVNLQCPIYSGCSVVDSGTPAQAAASVASGSGSSSGASSAAASGGNGGGFSCASSVPSRGGRAAWFGAIAALVGVVVGRAIRTRRRS
jgi:Uncharacterized protein conserved in bacteria (DUF2330)